MGSSVFPAPMCQQWALADTGAHSRLCVQRFYLGSIAKEWLTVHLTVQFDSQTSLEVQLILHDKTPILNHIILVAQSFYSKSHCWHPCQAGPRLSQKQKHFSQCQPLTPLVTLSQRKQPKGLERRSQETRGKSRLPFGWGWALQYTAGLLVLLDKALSL